MISINKKQKNEVETRRRISKNYDKNDQKKLPIFKCVCGTKILVVPDLAAMDKSIRNHIIEHQNLMELSLTEEILRQEILQVVLKVINETSLAKQVVENSAK